MAVELHEHTQNECRGGGGHFDYWMFFSGRGWYLWLKVFVLNENMKINLLKCFETAVKLKDGRVKNVWMECLTFVEKTYGAKFFPHPYFYGSEEIGIS